jgi:hypothetical protein
MREVIEHWPAQSGGGSINAKRQKAISLTSPNMRTSA